MHYEEDSAISCITPLLVSCASKSPEDYHIISNNTVDGYYIYEYEHNGIFCNTYYEDIYYSVDVYNYGFSFYGCSADMTFFINKDSEFINLQVAIEQGLISLESFMLELEELHRYPEEILSDEADYCWLDFHIDHKVVYAYTGGECDQYSSETFIIDGREYYYGASGCLQDHILFLRVNQVYISIFELLKEDEIDEKRPLLTEQP